MDKFKLDIKQCEGIATMAFKISPWTASSISPPIQRTNHLSLLKTTSLTGKLSVASCPHSKTTPLRISASRNFPARDKIINFGKYKGRMLGTLPSTYLKWVSTKLRYRDFAEWAELADEVLADPVYRDRIEWEFAHNALTGDNIAANPYSTGYDAVSELEQIKETFGWDSFDKDTWSKVDFALLGTSKGGRIPRAAAVVESGGGEVEREESGGDDGGRRRERRERMKQRRVIGSGTSSDVDGTSRSSGERVTGNGTSLDGAGTTRRSRKEDEEQSAVGRVPSPFPGRDALLRKALDRKRLI